jgi:hypothetical protein
MKKLITLLFILIGITAYSQPFANIQKDKEDGQYVDVQRLNYCDIIFGYNIHTPLGKVKKGDLKGYVECTSIQQAKELLNVEEKHFYNEDSVSYSQANADAKYRGYKTFIYENKVNKVK